MGVLEVVGKRRLEPGGGEGEIIDRLGRRGGTNREGNGSGRDASEGMREGHTKVEN